MSSHCALLAGIEIAVRQSCATEIITGESGVAIGTGSRFKFACLCRAGFVSIGIAR